MEHSGMDGVGETTWALERAVSRWHAHAGDDTVGGCRITSPPRRPGATTSLATVRAGSPSGGTPAAEDG